MTMAPATQVPQIATPSIPGMVPGAQATQPRASFARYAERAGADGERGRDANRTASEAFWWWS